MVRAIARHPRRPGRWPARDRGGQGARRSSSTGNAYGYDRAFTVSPDEETIERIHRLAALRAECRRSTRRARSVRRRRLDPVRGCPLRLRHDRERAQPGRCRDPRRDGRAPCRSSGPSSRRRSRRGASGGRSASRSGSIRSSRASETDETILGVHLGAHRAVPDDRAPDAARPGPLARAWQRRTTRRCGSTSTAMPGAITPAIVQGDEAAEYGARSTYKNGTATSVWTGETFGGDYIQEHAHARATWASSCSPCRSHGRESRGRQFRAPTDADLAAVAAAEARARATAVRLGDRRTSCRPSEIRSGLKTRPSRGVWDLTRWRDLFSPRQLLTNVTALEELREVVAEARSELGDEQRRALGALPRASRSTRPSTTTAGCRAGTRRA